MEISVEVLWLAYPQRCLTLIVHAFDEDYSKQHVERTTIYIYICIHIID